MIHNTIHLVCTKCLAVNRVPKDRLADQPVCGQCHEFLVPDYPLELTDNNFEKFIARTDVPIIVDFWAAWCGPCRMMSPAFSEAAAKLSPNFLLAKLNTEEFSQTAAKFEIQGIPCLIAFKHGTEIARQSGAMGAPQIIDWVNSLASQKGAVN